MIPHGDITNMQIVLSVPMPADREEKHQLWLETKGKEGLQWRGFADAAHYLKFSKIDAKGDDGVNAYERYLDTPFFFNFSLEARSLRTDGKNFNLKV